MSSAGNADPGATGCLGMVAGGSGDVAVKGKGKGRGKNRDPNMPSFAKPKKKAAKKLCPDYSLSCRFSVCVCVWFCRLALAIRNLIVSACI